MTRTQVHEGLEIGDETPRFESLLGTDGRRYSAGDFDAHDVLVVVFISNGCPTVRGYDERIIALQEEFAESRVRVLLINSNNPHLSPADTYGEMTARADEAGYRFPYLQDPSGEIARRFGAVSTPHAFVFDGDRRLRYRGRIDDSRNPDKVVRSDLREAVVQVIAGSAVTVPETQPFGCAIVW
jgi:peroxiredoxin